MEKELREKLERLSQWIDSLHIAAQSDLKEIQNTLFDKKYKLPEGCPSRASVAELVLRHTEKKLLEVNATFKEFREALIENIHTL